MSLSRPTRQVLLYLYQDQRAKYSCICIKTERLDIRPQASATRMLRAGRNTSCYCSPLLPTTHFLTMDGQNGDGG